MSKKNRIAKTAEGIVRDLDDHLFLLNQCVRGVVSGEDAFLKSLAAELRVLVCYSSSTEGLLWRLVDEFGVSDELELIVPHSMSEQSNQDSLPRIRYAPILDPEQVGEDSDICTNSLRNVIKVTEAVYALGTSHTHEKLISAFAQQSGSAHEDDGVDPHLVDLGDLSIANASLVSHILVLDAALVAKIGNRVMQAASEQQGYERTTRAHVNKDVAFVERDNHTTRRFHAQSLGGQEQGTLFHHYAHAHSDWRTNDYSYQFPDLTAGAITIRAHKHADGTFELEICGLTDEPLKYRQSTKQNRKNNDVMIAIAWSADGVSGFINGEPFVEEPSCTQE